MEKPNENKSLRERIALGECVSPYTTEYCLVCVDRCEASHWRMQVKDAVEQNGGKLPDKDGRNL